MITVKFSHPGEFIDELKKHPEEVAKKIVRLTIRKQTGAMRVTDVSVLGTAIRDGELVRLDSYCGSGHELDLKDILERAQKKCEEIELELKRFGFEIRAGFFSQSPGGKL